MLVGTCRQGAEGRLEGAPLRRARQEPPDHREPEPRPALRSGHRVVAPRVPPPGRGTRLPHGGAGRGAGGLRSTTRPAPGDSVHLLRAGPPGEPHPRRARLSALATERTKAGDEARLGIAARPHEAAEQIPEQAVPAHRRPQAADQHSPGGGLREAVTGKYRRQRTRVRRVTPHSVCTRCAVTPSARPWRRAVTTRTTAAQ